MKNKKIVIAAVVIVLLIFLGGGYYFLSFKNTSKPTNDLQAEQEIIPTISPLDLGLEIAIRDDKKAMKFEITKVDNIDSIEYQISYTKEVDGEEIPEGLIGEVKANSGDKKIGINYREFGTCSSGKCRYDKVVSPVKLTLKITKKDGKVYQAEKTIEI